MDQNIKEDNTTLFDCNWTINKDENNMQVCTQEMEEGMCEENSVVEHFFNDADENIKEYVQPVSRVSGNKYDVLNGADLNDIPVVYCVPKLMEYEIPVVGVYIDKRIIPGYKYKVRPIDQQEEFLFDGKALQLLSIGCGYSRRITFAPNAGTCNNNENYFWSDSRKHGFAFNIEVVSVGEKYTLFNVNRTAMGHLEIIKNLYPQEEISHTLKTDKSVEKSVKIFVLAKIDWFNRNDAVPIVCMSGIAICVKKKGTNTAETVRIIGVTIESDLHRTYYFLTPGIDNRKRCIKVSGKECNDIPITYSITGLEIYELPVIGTYVDSRILPGFFYKVRPVSSKEYLFEGKALCLQSIGVGYGKRITFAPDENGLNNNCNYFWSDSWPEGIAFEPRAVHCGMTFNIYAADECVGFASVFRTDNPQQEEKQYVVRKEGTTSVMKRIHVDITCNVTLSIPGGESGRWSVCDERLMRISGTAVLTKDSSMKQAKLLLIENIGLESQLNLLFFLQHTNIVFKLTD